MLDIISVWVYTLFMDYRATIQNIRGEFLRGKLTLQQAEDKVAPLLVEMNIKGKVVAKKFGKNYKKLTFGYVFR